MTKSEKKQLTEIHDTLTWLRIGISVNGASGLEPILTQHHKDIKTMREDIGELKELTSTSRTLRQFRKSYAQLEATPCVGIPFKVIGSTKFWLLILALGVSAIFGVSLKEIWDWVNHFV